MPKTKSRFSPISALIGVVVAALAALAISYFSGFGFWPAFGMAIVAMLVNGFIAVTGHLKVHHVRSLQSAPLRR